MAYEASGCPSPFDFSDREFRFTDVHCTACSRVRNFVSNFALCATLHTALVSDNMKSLILYSHASLPLENQETRSSQGAEDYSPRPLLCFRPCWANRRHSSTTPVLTTTLATMLQHTKYHSTEPIWSNTLVTRCPVVYCCMQHTQP